MRRMHSLSPHRLGTGLHNACKRVHLIVALGDVKALVHLPGQEQELHGTAKVL